MNTFRGSCPSCGDVELTTPDLRLEIDETLGAPRLSFAFDCRVCEAHVRGEASQELARSLQFAGVAIHVHRMPEEAREEHIGAPLSEDEVINFGLWLEFAENPLAELIEA